MNKLGKYWLFIMTEDGKITRIKTEEVEIDLKIIKSSHTKTSQLSSIPTTNILLFHKCNSSMVLYLGLGNKFFSQRRLQFKLQYVRAAFKLLKVAITL